MTLQAYSNLPPVEISEPATMRMDSHIKEFLYWLAVLRTRNTTVDENLFFLELLSNVDEAFQSKVNFCISVLKSIGDPDLK